MFVAIVLVTTVLSALWGRYKGLLHLGLRLAALVIAYAFTWQETPALVALLAERGWVTGVAAWLVAGTGLFIIGSVVCSLLARWLAYVAPEHWHDRGRLPGALLGGVMGLAVGLLLVWTVGTLQDGWRARTAQADTGLQRPNATVADALHMPQHEAGQDDPAPASREANQLVRELSAEVVATVTQKALGGTPAAQTAVQMIRNPVSVGDGLQTLANQPYLRALFENPANYAVMVQGTVDDVVRLPDFQALTEDTELMQFLSTMGLAGDTVPERSHHLAVLLSQYARNFESLRATPAFQQVAQDPALRAKLQEGNLMALLTDDKVRQMAEMLTSKPAASAPAALGAAPALTTARVSTGGGESVVDVAGAALPKQKPVARSLYRWKDRSGRVHITEDKPPEGVEADVIQAR